MIVRCANCQFEFDVPATGGVVGCVCPRCGNPFEAHGTAMPQQPLPMPPRQAQQPQVVVVKSGGTSPLVWVLVALIVALVIAGAVLLVGGGFTKRSTDSSIQVNNQPEMAVQAASKLETIDDLRRMIIAEPRSHEVIEKWAHVLSDVRLTENDIWGIDSATLRYLRNAIFAKHNYRFKSNDLMEFYCHYDWYQPLKANVTHELNRVEVYNIDFIKKHE